MEVLFEKIAIYGGTALVVLTILIVYLAKLRRETRLVEAKINIAKERGSHEPVSLHPVVNPNSCIRTGACIIACPEKDILGISNGRATIINASRCIGHGACFHACPVEAISLCIGTEKRGVDLPHVNEHFETNVPGIFIAGEIGGMGLIKNAVEQGRQAVNNLTKGLDHRSTADYDLVIVGAGPAGISASLEAKRLKLNALTLEQDSLGGTIYSFPRAKVVMTHPMQLPLHGKLRLYETSKPELLELWQSLIAKHEIQIQEQTKVNHIHREGRVFRLDLNNGETISSRRVLLAIGRRGTPRKLGVEGELAEKVAYRLIEPELVQSSHVLIVGGGDSAVEAAMMLSDHNEVTISYRGEKFSRIKPKNQELINEQIQSGKINVIYNSIVNSIQTESVNLKINESRDFNLPNDLVYVFAGGELPTGFLEKSGIMITKKFGEALLSHQS